MGPAIDVMSGRASWEPRPPFVIALVYVAIIGDSARVNGGGW
jgi:hypothetical protein